MLGYNYCDYCDKPILTINLGAIANNWLVVKRQVEVVSRANRPGYPPAECGAVVKTNAYGLGLNMVAPALSKVGCREFFVANISEGILLRRILPQSSIYIFNGLPPGGALAVIQNKLIPVISSMPELEEWAQASRGHHPSAIQVDIGMNRLGLTRCELEVAMQTPGLFQAAKVDLLVGHLSQAECPDGPINAHQFEAFKQISALLPDVRKSLANSAGVCCGLDFHFDLVRPGISIYGGEIVGKDPPSNIRPVVSLMAPVLQVRYAKAGEYVGYGDYFRLEKDSTLAVVACGFAQGIRRNTGFTNFTAFINDHRIKILGQVSMDMTIFDITDVPNVQRGDMVEIIGPNTPLRFFAEALQTVASEILTCTSNGVQFRYLP